MRKPPPPRFSPRVSLVPSPAEGVAAVDGAGVVEEVPAERAEESGGQGLEGAAFRVGEALRRVQVLEERRPVVLLRGVALRQIGSHRGLRKRGREVSARREAAANNCFYPLPRQVKQL